jgi:hypothetical protein
MFAFVCMLLHVRACLRACVCVRVYVHVRVLEYVYACVCVLRRACTCDFELLCVCLHMSIESVQAGELVSYSIPKCFYVFKSNNTRA